MKNQKILWITTTAVFIALLVTAQAATASFGQLVTGSLVNLILIVSVMTCGAYSGATVALMSPIFAKILGIGPLWTIIPFVMAGNIVLVLLWRGIGKRRFANGHIVRVVALIIAAVGKFLTLYVGVVRIALPFLLELPEKQAEKISLMFSFPQLITVSIGGALALAVLPVVEIVTRPHTTA